MFTRTYLENEQSPRRIPTRSDRKQSKQIFTCHQNKMRSQPYQENMAQKIKGQQL